MINPPAEHLSQAERLIAECKNRIARQREVIADAFRKGHDTEVPVSMLRALEASLRAFETHRQLILDRKKKGEAAMTGKNRVMIYGPKGDGTYVIEFRTAAGEALAISIPKTDASVVRYFQERMPYGLFVPDVP
jgi:hypothetical protein